MQDECVNGFLTGKNRIQMQSGFGNQITILEIGFQILANRFLALFLEIPKDVLGRAVVPDAFFFVGFYAGRKGRSFEVIFKR